MADAPNAAEFNDDGVLEITDKGVEALQLVICNAWHANIQYIYPEDTEYPDPIKQSEIAAKATGALLCEWLMRALGK